MHEVLGARTSAEPRDLVVSFVPTLPIGSSAGKPLLLFSNQLPIFYLARLSPKDSIACVFLSPSCNMEQLNQYIAGPVLYMCHFCLTGPSVQDIFSYRVALCGCSYLPDLSQAGLSLLLT